MKRIFYIFCIAVVGGFVFLLTYNGFSTLKATPSVSDFKVSEIRKSVSEMQTTANTHNPKVKTENQENEPCSCCRKSLELLKKRRKALEKWARDMITQHGYEEGMKRVTSRSPVLAKRIQLILEKEMNNPNLDISQQNQQEIPHADTSAQKTSDKR